MDITTIRIQKKLLKELRRLELHSRETNEQIIQRLLENTLISKEKKSK